MIIPNDTRWHSTHDAAVRAWKLRPAIQQFLDLQRLANPSAGILKDELNNSDWQTVGYIIEILTPFRRFTKRLEGNRDNGALYEIVQLFELLKKEFTKSYQRHLNTRLAITTSLDFALKKLKSYYNFERMPPVIFAAVILHPDLKMRYFETIYRLQPDTLALVKRKVDTLWNDYFHRHSSTSDENPSMYSEFQSQAEPEFSQILDDFSLDSLLDNWKSEYPGNASQLGISAEIGSSTIDELEVFLSEPLQATKNPVEWWIGNTERFPTLAKLALDVFSIPAMSSECERVFSK